MTNENTRKPSAVDKFAGSRAAKASDEEQFEESITGLLRNETFQETWGSPFRQTWRVARPHGREDIMLDCRFSEGGRRAFGYTWLASITYEPGTLKLVFGEITVTIAGRNLDRLYDALVQHRVPFIQEGSDAEEALKPEDEPHIEEISIDVFKKGDK